MIYLRAGVRSTLKPDGLPGAAIGQSTKSLRDSPLRGGLPARAVTKGEIVDSGRRALS